MIFLTKSGKWRSQEYYPHKDLKLPIELQHKLTKSAYLRAIDQANELYIKKGWIQEFEIADFYKPDFIRSHPF